MYDLRSHFALEVKHLLDVVSALLPATVDLFTPHGGAGVPPTPLNMETLTLH